MPGTARVATIYYIIFLSRSNCMFSCYQARAEIMFGLSSLWSFNVSPPTTFHTAVIFQTKFVSLYVFDDFIDMTPLLKEGRTYPFYDRDIVPFPFSGTSWGFLSTRIVKAPTADGTEEWIKALPTAV